MFIIRRSSNIVTTQTFKRLMSNSLNDLNSSKSTLATTSTTTSTSGSTLPSAIANSSSSRLPSKHHKAKKSNTKSNSKNSQLNPPVTKILTELKTLNLNNIKKNHHHSSNSDGKAIALSTAESYNTPALIKSLQLSNITAMNLLGEAIYIPQWSPTITTEPTTTTTTTIASSDTAGEETGELFIFETGSIVSWGLSVKGLETFLSQVIRSGPPSLSPSNLNLDWIEKNRYAESESEVLEYWVEPDGATRMVGDSIYLTTPPGMLSSSASSVDVVDLARDQLLARLAFAAGMTRVTKLGLYEEQFDEFAEGLAGIPKLLETGSESPVEKTDIIKRVGTLHNFRQKLNLEDENLLDEPEFLWEDADLQAYYTSVCNALEFETRLRTLNQRIEYGFHLQSTLMDILNTKTSHRLEWIIIILIAFEITIVLLREGFALSHEASEGVKKVSEVSLEKE